jgi:hypothetical protein
MFKVTAHSIVEEVEREKAAGADSVDPGQHENLMIPLVHDGAEVDPTPARGPGVCVPEENALKSQRSQGCFAPSLHRKNAV